MKDCTFSFTVVPHKDGDISCNLEVGTFPAKFGLPSVLVPFMRSDEELR